MPSPDTVRIRIRSGPSEAEIEADLAHIHEVIELIPEIASRLPASEPARAAPSSSSVAALGDSARADAPAGSVPAITVEKGDSLNDIVAKFFADPWGKSPRKLLDVRTALQSYGLNYPKQSVAVALLRLAKSSKIRRFKSEGGEYVYTASTSIIAPRALQPALVDEPAEEEVASSVNV